MCVLYALYVCMFRCGVRDRFDQQCDNLTKLIGKVLDNKGAKDKEKIFKTTTKPNEIAQSIFLKNYYYENEAT